MSILISGIDVYFMFMSESINLEKKFVNVCMINTNFSSIIHLLAVIIFVFLILSWIYGINCRKYVVLKNCYFPVYGKCQESCKRSYIISETACVGCVGE